MRRSKKLFLLFVIIWLLIIVYLMIDFSNKSYVLEGKYLSQGRI